MRFSSNNKIATWSASQDNNHTEVELCCLSFMKMQDGNIFSLWSLEESGKNSEVTDDHQSLKRQRYWWKQGLKGWVFTYSQRISVPSSVSGWSIQNKVPLHHLHFNCTKAFTIIIYHWALCKLLHWCVPLTQTLATSQLSSKLIISLVSNHFRSTHLKPGLLKFFH